MNLVKRWLALPTLALFGERCEECNGAGAFYIVYPDEIEQCDVCLGKRRVRSNG